MSDRYEFYIFCHIKRTPDAKAEMIKSPQRWEEESSDLKMAIGLGLDNFGQ